MRAGQSPLDRLLGDQTRRDHNGRVGGVGATGDGGDHHAAVLQGHLLAARQLHLGRDHRVGPARRGSEFGETGVEGRLRLIERDPVLRTLRAGDTRDDAVELEFEHFRVLSLCVTWRMEETLLSRVGVDEFDLLGGPPRELEIPEGFRVYGEDRAGGAELGRHVADRRPVCQREIRDPRAEELDQVPDHSTFTEHLCDGEYQVGCGGTIGKLSLEANSHHLRQQHRDRLAEHRRLGLDSAYPPAEHAEPVHHRGVGVGSNQRVGIGPGFA